MINTLPLEYPQLSMFSMRKFIHKLTAPILPNVPDAETAYFTKFIHELTARLFSPLPNIPDLFELILSIHYSISLIILGFYLCIFIQTTIFA